jgi:adenine-specific DNA-methyltransferase
MPTLHWIGKEKVMSHDGDVPYRVLEHGYGFDSGKETTSPTNSGNKIIHGDNLEALKSLLPEYEGKIKCIYIDPPYNTGNEGWVYNDNVNHPSIKKWLGEVVGKESEDLTRHDKWLCMMYPRLKLLHRLLSEDGAIFISIDDNEQANLKLICDEIFGAGNFIGTLPTVMNLKGNQDQYAFAGSHEYTICYSKKIDKSKFNQLAIDEEDSDSWEVDDVGYFKKGATLRATGAESKREDRPYMFYPILVFENTISTIKKDEFEKVYSFAENKFDDDFLNIIKQKYESRGYEFVLPIESANSYGRWRWGYNDKTIEKLQNEVIRIDGKNGSSFYKKQRPELGDLPSKKPKSILYKPNYSSGNGTNLLKKIFSKKEFENPKPLELIEDIITIGSSKDSIILDSFAGSGTTAHAVLNLNKQDGGNRKFILIEMEDYANTITAERVKRVINGYADKEGTGGSFDYYSLGEPLFIGDNQEELNPAIPIEKMKEYIWFSETREAYQGENKEEPNLLGVKEDTAYYFFYSNEDIHTLDYELLALIKTKASQYVIYANNCLLPKDYMLLKNIRFKQIPGNISRL